MNYTEKDEHLRYPIGRFEYQTDYSLDNLRKDIKIIAKFPKTLKALLKKLKSGGLKLTYRKGGWTVHQIIHHLADSHLHAYIRIKMALTEPNPVIKPYDEALWAQTEDGSGAPIRPSIKLLSAHHERWSYLLKSLSEDDLERSFFHPEHRRLISIAESIAFYAWHCRHHLAHINIAAIGQMMPKDFARLPDDPLTIAPEVPLLGHDEPRMPERKARVEKESGQIIQDEQTIQNAPAPKMTRQEALAKAREARSEKAAAKKTDDNL